MEEDRLSVFLGHFLCGFPMPQSLAEDSSPEGFLSGDLYIAAPVENEEVDLCSAHHNTSTDEDHRHYQPCHLL